MFQVEISNIDRSFFGIFDVAEPELAAKMAVDYLCRNNGFFDNTVPVCEKDAGVRKRSRFLYVGFCSNGDPECEIEDENTYWIYVTECVLNSMSIMDMD